MLVQLGKLPMYWVDVHVVVLLKVLRQQLNRVIPGMQPPLALKDFLHLRDRGEQMFLLAFSPTDFRGFSAQATVSRAAVLL